MPIRIIHHQRLAGKGHYSIERLFESIRSGLGPDMDASVCTSPFPSRGIFPRLRNLQAASRIRADVHHVVGDVHYLAFALPAKRLVLTIHDCASLERLRLIPRMILKALWFSGPMRRAEVVTTISNTTRNELRRWVGPLADRVVVIPNCVSSEFVPVPKPFNSRQPVVLQVGAGWNKNLAGVVAGLAGTPCQLEIVGSVSSEQRKLLQNSSVPHRLLGRVSNSELLQAYQRSDLVVFTSIYEGFGLPILEAQATGRAVVTSNCYSMPEAAGDAALLVDPREPNQIHQAVMRIVQDEPLRNRLIADGFTNVQRFSIQRIASEYERVYRSVAPQVR